MSVKHVAGRILLTALLALLVVAAPSARAADPIPPEGVVLSPTVITGSTAPAPTAAGVKKITRSVLASSSLGSFSALVIDPATKETLLEVNPGKARIPASTLKLLTAAAALEVLGPDTRLPTTSVSEAGTLYLVGGGDPSLVRSDGGDPMIGGSASLKDLADRTAKVLGHTAVQLNYDDSLFTGPETAPGWPAKTADSGTIAPVTALMVDEGRIRPGAIARVHDPATQAARVFAKYLKQAGVGVTGMSAAKAPATAKEIARVESPPVKELVERMLTDSSNNYGEALAHLVGGATGDGASFKGGAKAVVATAAKIGLPTDGLVIVDGSGLSRRDAVPVATYGALLLNTVLNTDPALAAITSGLPVAGATGTLIDRFRQGPTAAAAGYVRAKTGTLTGVVGLTGTVQDKDGRVLIFVILANNVFSVDGARNSVDLFAADLAKCGCAR